MMEKRGIVEPGRTPDTEDKVTPANTKTAASKSQPAAQVEQLDDDFTKRAADAVQQR